MSNRPELLFSRVVSYLCYCQDKEEVDNAYCPTGEGGGQDNSCPPGEPTNWSSMSTDDLKKRFKRIMGSKDLVDGRRPGNDADNMSSISSSLTNYEILPGIRRVKTSEFSNWQEKDSFYSLTEKVKVEALAAKIQKNNFISPLIVVVDKEGPYVLEGGHRYDALKLLRAKELPAIIVVDRDDIVANADGVWRTIRGAKVFIEDGKITKGPKALVGKSEGEVSKEPRGSEVVTIEGNHESSSFDVRVFRNLTVEELKQTVASNEWGVRGIKDKTTSNTHVWGGNVAVHGDVAKALGLQAIDQLRFEIIAGKTATTGWFKEPGSGAQEVKGWEAILDRLSQ